MVAATLLAIGFTIEVQVYLFILSRARVRILCGNMSFCENNVWEGITKGRRELLVQCLA